MRQSILDTMIPKTPISNRNPKIPEAPVSASSAHLVLILLDQDDDPPRPCLVVRLAARAPTVNLGHRGRLVVAVLTDRERDPGHARIDCDLAGALEGLEVAIEHLLERHVAEAALVEWDNDRLGRATLVRGEVQPVRQAAALCRQRGDTKQTNGQPLVGSSRTGPGAGRW